MITRPIDIAEAHDFLKRSKVYPCCAAQAVVAYDTEMKKRREAEIILQNAYRKFEAEVREAHGRLMAWNMGAPGLDPVELRAGMAQLKLALSQLEETRKAILITNPGSMPREAVWIGVDFASGEVA